MAADINNVEYRKVLLSHNYLLNAANLLAATDSKTKLIFLCSPNNPTGNLLNRIEIVKILTSFHGLVILDEAYIDFANDEGFLTQLSNYQNLIVLQTFSKAWGMASIRLGMAFASHTIIAILNKIKYPYNINLLTQQYALEAVVNDVEKCEWVELILTNKKLLLQELETVDIVKEIYASDANFILVKVDDLEAIAVGVMEIGVAAGD